MPRNTEVALRAVMTAEAFVLLMPTTLTYLGGLFLVLVAAGAGVPTLFDWWMHDDPRFPGLLGEVVLSKFSLFMVVSAYALTSAWWLLIAGFRRKTLRAIPIGVWVGALAGLLQAFGMSHPFSWTPMNQMDMSQSQFWFKNIAGLGPLIVVVSSVVWLALNSSCKHDR